MKSLALAMLVCSTMAVAAPATAAVKSVVLVHGAFADGSGWKPLADVLTKRGYAVHVVQIPETTYEDDVAATKRALDAAGPSVLVGHSYGGMVITAAGTHANAKSLVYVAAFQPEAGESAGALEDKIKPAATSIGPAGEGFLQINPEMFAADFAADVPKDMVKFMALSQVTISTQAFAAKATDITWKTKPSFAVVAKDDRMISPELERFMAKRAKSETIELPGSHCVFISHPNEVAKLIEKAASSEK
jgi:pimeloyl-ACP methyl ester carboxylesterase